MGKSNKYKEKNVFYIYMVFYSMDFFLRNQGFPDFYLRNSLGLKPIWIQLKGDFKAIARLLLQVRCYPG